MATKRVVLASITARLLWDGRAEAGRFIPGIAHFQVGVAALRRSGDAVAADRLAEIDEAIRRAELAVNRWALGIEAFARETLGGEVAASPGWADGAGRRLRIRTPEAQRLAALICAFDAACAATATVTAMARRRRVFNPHHASIGERARMIRRVADLGHAGGLACRRTGGARRGRGRV